MIGRTRTAAVLLATLLVAAPVAAKAPPAWPMGTYGNVRTHAETGDMLGMEARFYEDDGQHFVEFVWCEGWCNDVYVLPVTRGDNGFLFDYSQRVDGEPSALEYHFVARPVGGVLKIGAWQGHEPMDEGQSQQLRKLAKPFAIPFARVNGAH